MKYFLLFALLTTFIPTLQAEARNENRSIFQCQKESEECQPGVFAKNCCPGLSCEGATFPGDTGECVLSCREAGETCQPSVIGRGCCDGLECVGSNFPGAVGRCR